MSFDDEIEIFDASAEFHDAEGVLRYRAQELGDDAKALKIIYEGVRGYVRAFDDLALWNPKADIDIEKGLDGLFEGRDWTTFISHAELRVPEVARRRSFALSAMTLNFPLSRRPPPR
ncbi:hypothetical protein J2W42_000656 [Rhizobium tibeticum]|uniref:hypothetical protein n=1 Tax=Rhizobium tibeticum TaxID=501024 RepID=UPI0027866966|nr:hypothetical protein [Rhizobium tibeticum]MDP9807818.1 hypothetical protein [Rhizobium tibeticum]